MISSASSRCLSGRFRYFFFLAFQLAQLTAGMTAESSSCGDDLFSVLQVASAVHHRGHQAPMKSQIMVTLPAGVRAGDQIRAKTPDGQTMQFPIPAGTSAGEAVAVLYTPLESLVEHVQAVGPVEATVVSEQASSRPLMAGADSANMDALRTAAVQQPAATPAVTHVVQKPAQAVAPAPASGAASSHIMVAVPTGVKPGDTIRAQTPDGQMLEFPAPAGSAGGELVPVYYTPLAGQQPQALSPEQEVALAKHALQTAPMSPQANEIALANNVLQSSMQAAASGASAPVQSHITVQLPSIMAAGDKIKAQTPDGQTVQFAVPAGARPGDHVKVSFTPLSPHHVQTLPAAAPQKQSLEAAASTMSQIVQSSKSPAVKSDLSTHIMVAVPQGVKAGDKIRAQTPDGQTVEITVPAGAAGGELVPILYTPLQAQQAATQNAVKADMNAAIAEKESENTALYSTHTGPRHVPTDSSPPTALAAASSKMMVIVPSEARAGDRIQAQTPDGRTLEFPLPVNSKAGEQVSVLYTPVKTNSPVQAVEVAPPKQHVEMVENTATQNTEIISARAHQEKSQESTISQRAQSDALATAAMEKEAVDKVMKEYENMSNMDDESAEVTAWLKTEQAQKKADWEAAADTDAARAAEEAVTYKAWKRSQALQDVAMAKHAFASESASYSAAKDHAVTVAGTDAAWKAAARVPAPKAAAAVPATQHEYVAAPAPPPVLTSSSVTSELLDEDED